MKKVYIPLISSGPEIESAIGIFIVLFILFVVLLTSFSFYKKIQEISKIEEVIPKNKEINK